MNPCKIVLADDHNLVRAGLRTLLDALACCQVVGEAANGEALVAQVEALRPDLVLTDITMPGVNGLEATSQIMKRWPLTKVIILTMYEDEEYVTLALSHGAVGYLLKDSAPSELETAIQTVMKGQVYLSPLVSSKLIGTYAQQLRSDKKLEPTLSPRQREVLQLIAQGQSTKDIARLLSLSVKTIETHRSRMMQQLDIHEVTGLVRYAIKNGLISSL